MAEYINRKQIQYTWWQKPDGTFTDGVTLESIINAMPTADVVEFDVIKKWLHDLAFNNVGVKFDGDFSNACEEIISRLDGLRDFAKEGRSDNGKA